MERAAGQDDVGYAGRGLLAFWLREGRVVAGVHVNVRDTIEQIEALIRGGVPSWRRAT